MGGNVSRKTGRAAAGAALLGALLIALGAACGAGGGTKVEPQPDPDPGPGQDAEAGVVSDPPQGATQVDVILTEWKVGATPLSVPAGETYFLADNAGGEAHEFVVIKTDLDPGELPVIDGKVQEDRVDIIGEIEPYKAGTQASIAFDLAPGSYALICNIVEEESSGKLESHYEEGMYTGFTVE